MNLQERVAALSHLNNDSPLFFIMGTCAIESEQLTLRVAEYLKQLSEKYNFHVVYKSSFDKANRTSVSGYRSVGMDEGLQILSKVRSEVGLPVLTDVHESSQVAAVADVVDVIQIPAFLCRQTDLLLAAAQTGKPIHLKKGQFITPAQAQKAVEKITAANVNSSVWIAERGYTFGYGNLVVDYKNFPQMKKFAPVIFDSHSVQLPGAIGGASSGGQREFIAPLAIAAVSQGIAGVFMEVHPEPEKALSDGPNSVRLSTLESLIIYLQELDQFVKSKKTPETI